MRKRDQYRSSTRVISTRKTSRFGIDTVAAVWLNGEEIGRPENMLIAHSFDVTQFKRRDADNELVVRIGSAVSAAHSFEFEPLHSALDTNMAQLPVRKAAHMYGSDIAPRAVSAGLWRPLVLEHHEPTEIRTCTM